MSAPITQGGHNFLHVATYVNYSARTMYRKMCSYFLILGQKQVTSYNRIAIDEYEIIKGC